MEGIYTIGKTLINLSQVRAIYGNEEFVYFDMGTGMGNGYNFNGYDLNKVLNDMKFMEQRGKKIWGYAYEY